VCLPPPSFIRTRHQIYLNCHYCHQTIITSISWPFPLILHLFLSWQFGTAHFFHSLASTFIMHAWKLAYCLSFPILPEWCTTVKKMLDSKFDCLVSFCYAILISLFCPLATYITFCARTYRWLSQNFFRMTFSVVEGWFTPWMTFNQAELLPGWPLI